MPTLTMPKRTEIKMTTDGSSAKPLAVLLLEHELAEGLTDVELAERLGTDQAQVSRWRRGIGVPRSSWIPVLAEELDVDEETPEESRVESERLRKELAEKKTVDPKEELKRTRAELRAANAKIRRLEEKLRKGNK